MEKAKLGLVVIISFFLLLSAEAYAATDSSSARTRGNDVILEKLNNIQTQIDDLKSSISGLKTSFDNVVIKKDSEIKEINNSIVEVRLTQEAQKTKINIMWALFGAIAGGGAITGGTAIRKKRNGNSKASGDNNGSG